MSSCCLTQSDRMHMQIKYVHNVIGIFIFDQDLASSYSTGMSQGHEAE